MSRHLTIHDAFFKQVIGAPAMADRFLREHLPPALVALLGDESPERLPGSFVDEELGQHHSDLLLRIGLRGGGVVLVHLVVEHKSSPDPLSRLQLLRYEVRILAQWVRDRRQAGLLPLPLPPVVPLLVHHGPQGWTIPTGFAELFGPVPEELRDYLPSFRHALVDLVRTPDPALSSDAGLRMRLKALKYALRPDVERYLEAIVAEAVMLDAVDVIMVLTYIIFAPAGVGKEAVRAALYRIAPSRAEELMTTWTQKYVDQGRAEGKSEMLLRRRFGSLAPDVEARVRIAGNDQIDQWSERVLDARDLAEVLAEGPPH